MKVIANQQNICWEANLTGADLSEASLTNIKFWRNVKSIEEANIFGVKNPPDGFIEWATEHRAVSIEDNEEWRKLLQEKTKREIKIS